MKTESFCNERSSKKINSLVISRYVVYSSRILKKIIEEIHRKERERERERGRNRASKGKQRIESFFLLLIRRIL